MALGGMCGLQLVKLFLHVAIDVMLMDNLGQGPSLEFRELLYSVLKAGHIVLEAIDCPVFEVWET